MMVFFDLDGTLLDEDRAARAACVAFRKAHADLFPQSEEDFVSLWRDLAEKHVERHWAGELSFQGQRRERMKELFGLVGRRLNDADADRIFQVYLKEYEANWSLYPDALGCLDALRHRPLGVISNGDTTQQRRKMENTGITAYFSVVAISGAVGVTKPQPGIFLHASRAAGQRPDQCVYVGDRLHTDALGSRNAGFHGVWLDRHGNASTDDHIVRITSLAEMPNVVEKMEVERR